MRFRLFVFAAACACAALVLGCGSNASGTVGAGPPDADAADAGTAGDGSASVACSGAAPSFATAVRPIFEASCRGEMCHNGTAGPTFPYGSLVNVGASRDTCPSAGLLVVPESLEKSYLVRKITGVGICAGSLRMPPRQPLPASDIQTIADWVCAGAKND